MQGFTVRTRAAVAVLLLALVPPAPSRKAPKHDTGGIKVRELTSGEYPGYGPPLPSYGGPPTYGSFEHHSFPSYHPPPSPSYEYPVSYGHPPPFEIEVYEEPVHHRNRGKGKGKGRGKGSKEDIKEAIAEWKIEKWFEKGMQKLSKSFGYGESEEYEVVEYGAPPPPLFHAPPLHYPPPHPHPPPSYHPPPPIYPAPTPKLVEVRVPKCKAQIKVPTYVTETLVKTSKVHITKVVTTTKEVQVKEYIVNTKYSTKTKTVTEHVPQYVEPKTVTEHVPHYVEPKTISLPAETIYKTQPPKTIYKTKTHRETLTKTSYHEIKAPVPTYGAPLPTSSGSSGSSEGSYRMYQHTPRPPANGKGKEVSYEKVIPFYAKIDSVEDSSYAHF